VSRIHWPCKHTTERAELKRRRRTRVRHRAVDAELDIGRVRKSCVRMVYLEWDEFYRQSEALYRANPLKASSVLSRIRSFAC
jgi:hypothetical protein